MAIVKSIPDDFQVDEVFSQPELSANGKYSYAVMRKKGFNSISAARLLAGIFNLIPKDIGFAGLKDKNAVTSQLMSLKGISEERIRNFSHPVISLDYIGRGSEPVTVGMLLGNRFRIVLRDCSGNEKKTISENLGLLGQGVLIPNYFGSQRFSKSNHHVGRAIVLGNFREAAMILDGAESPNPVSRLRLLPSRLLRLLVHSYQSYIFNSCLSEYLYAKSSVSKTALNSGGKMVFPLEPMESESLPVLGFSTELEKSSPGFSSIMSSFMKREGITGRSFVIRSIPYISSEGSERESMMSIKNASVEEENGNCIISFELGKGSYATVALAFLLSEVRKAD